MSNGNPSKAESIRLLGFHRQLDQLVEECAEVIAAAMRYRRGRIPEADLIEEIADVLIVADQFAVHYGEALDAEVLRKGVKAIAAWKSEPRATGDDLKATAARMVQAKLDEVSDRLTAANIEIAALRRQIDEMEPARAKFTLDPVDGVRDRCIATYEIRTKAGAVAELNPDPEGSAVRVVRNLDVPAKPHGFEAVFRHDTKIGK